MFKLHDKMDYMRDMMEEYYYYYDEYESYWGTGDYGCYEYKEFTYTYDGYTYTVEYCYKEFPDHYYYGGDGPQQIAVYPLEEAVCCMPGMDCWNAAYEGAAGKDAMIAELERLVWNYPEVKAHFDDLNAENVEKAALALQEEFAYYAS